jgi:hypothetical protein
MTKFVGLLFSAIQRFSVKIQPVLLSFKTFRNAFVEIREESRVLMMMSCRFKDLLRTKPLFGGWGGVCQNLIRFGGAPKQFE